MVSVHGNRLRRRTRSRPEFGDLQALPASPGHRRKKVGLPGFARRARKLASKTLSHRHGSFGRAHHASRRGPNRGVRLHVGPVGSGSTAEAMPHRSRVPEAKCRRARFSVRRCSAPVYESFFAESRAGKSGEPPCLNCQDQKRRRKRLGHRILPESAASPGRPLRGNAGYRHQPLTQFLKTPDVSGAGDRLHGTTRWSVVILRVVRSPERRREFLSCADYWEPDAGHPRSSCRTRIVA